jgi:hypothetical protein
MEGGDLRIMMFTRYLWSTAYMVVSKWMDDENDKLSQSPRVHPKQLPDLSNDANAHELHWPDPVDKISVKFKIQDRYLGLKTIFKGKG